MRDFRNMSDQAVLESARQAAKVEREATTDVLHHLREVERRRLFVDLKYESLFDYAVGDLKLSPPSAQRRIDAMKLLKDLPELEEKIESGSLNLTVLSQAQKFFRAEAKVKKPMAPQAKRELLTVLVGKSTREVERELISRSSEPLALRRESIRPVSETHSELKFLASQETLDQLTRIRGLLGHSHSELSMAELIALLAKMTLEKLDPAREPKKKASQSVPAPEPTQASKYSPVISRYIPAPVRREVWRRDLGKCTGCGGVNRLQIDHIIPLAKGGTHALENLRLLCFHCNQRQADLKLGREKMELHRNTKTNPSPSEVLGLAGGAAKRTRAGCERAG